MLLFIKRQCVHFITYLIFQYISCYCLSPFSVLCFTRNFYFNTSHVTVYRTSTYKSFPKISYFNTSHVTVYLLFLYIYHTLSQFQYISCYCLSAGISFNSDVLFHFNTSHVTVYHSRLYHQVPVEQFQYISCYCLSWRPVRIM